MEEARSGRTAFSVWCYIATCRKQMSAGCEEDTTYLMKSEPASYESFCRETRLSH